MSCNSVDLFVDCIISREAHCSQGQQVITCKLLHGATMWPSTRFLSQQTPPGTTATLIHEGRFKFLRACMWNKICMHYICNALVSAV